MRGSSFFLPLPVEREEGRGFRACLCVRDRQEGGGGERGRPWRRVDDDDNNACVFFERESEQGEE